MTSTTFVIKVAEPYANALLDIAKSNQLVDEVTNDVNTISQLLTTTKDLKNFLSNPIAKIDSKKKVLNTIFKEQLNPVTFSFLMILVDRNRINFLDDIAQRYLELAYKMASIEVADVFSAIPLSADQQSDLIKKLEILTGANQVKLNLAIDVSLISGFMVKIGTRVVDASLAGQLRQISYHLGAAV